VRHIGTNRSREDLNEHSLKEGGILILKDDPEATDWYCAEIRKVLVDRIEVNYFTTQTPALENPKNVLKKAEGKDWAYALGRGALVGVKANQQQFFRRRSMPEPTIFWWVKLPMESVHEHILIRDVGLDATGKMDQTTLNLAIKLFKIPHHQGVALVGRRTSLPKKHFNDN
jgi:hypothetical protein